MPSSVINADAPLAAARPRALPPRLGGCPRGDVVRRGRRVVCRCRRRRPVGATSATAPSRDEGRRAAPQIRGAALAPPRPRRAARPSRRRRRLAVVAGRGDPSRLPSSPDPLVVLYGGGVFQFSRFALLELPPSWRSAPYRASPRRPPRRRSGPRRWRNPCLIDTVCKLCTQVLLLRFAARSCARFRRSPSIPLQRVRTSKHVAARQRPRDASRPRGSPERGAGVA